MSSKTAEELRKFKSDIYDLAQPQYVKQFNDSSLHFGRRILTPFESRASSSTEKVSPNVARMNVEALYGRVPASSVRPTPVLGMSTPAPIPAASKFSFSQNQSPPPIRSSTPAATGKVESVDSKSSSTSSSMQSTSGYKYRVRDPAANFFDPYQKNEVSFHIHGNRTVHEDGSVGAPFVGDRSLIKQSEHIAAKEIEALKKKKGAPMLSPFEKFQVPLTENQKIGWNYEKRKADGAHIDSAVHSTLYRPQKMSTDTRHAQAMMKQDQQSDYHW
eukprot:ANDGO_03156.mRNA.1 hypothetical protein